jgi:beta-lactamase superfamily II metal-dependent hydrolase
VFQGDLLVRASEALTIYLLGPGVGESMVLIMPDERVVVVDACGWAGTNLSVQLLRELEIEQIDLLIVTHPDLDHVKGLTELLAFNPARVWRYPFGLLRELLAVLTNAEASSNYHRHTEALRGSVALDDLLREKGNVHEVTYGRSWPSRAAGYTVHALAPTSYDTHRAREQVRGLVERRHGRWTLSPQAKAWLDDDKPLGDLPNMVSLGIAIEWGDRRLILAGDIENGDGGPYSGWTGVLDQLDRSDDQRGYLVEDVDLIKIAHHGSKRAFSKNVWERHARSRKAIGVVTTYSPKKLPELDTLQALRAHCHRLGIAADAGEAFDRAMVAGWSVADTKEPAPSSTSPCLRVVLTADGRHYFQRGHAAGWFE